MNRCEEVLAHHGVKGMHWGIRRYQNPDGSLTAAGRKRLEKSERRNVYAKRIESKAVDRERKNSSAMLKSAEKKWNKVKDSKDSKRKDKIQDRYEFAKQFDSKVAKKQEESRRRANQLTNEYVKKYGDKKLKDIKTNADGSIGDSEVKKVIKNALLGGALSAIIPASPVITGMAIGQSTNRTSSWGMGDKMFRKELKTANKEWKSNNKEISVRQEKQFKNVNKDTKSELSKKEQKSNLKELSNLSKSSGFDSAMKKLDRGDSAGFEKDMDRIRSKGVPKSNVIDKIAQSKPVTNAQKEHDKALSEWTKAQKELSDYVKKNGYPQSDKHSETTKDPTYNRLQEAADKAYDANSRAYDKLQKSIYSEMGKQIGKDPTADNLEAIRYMIELQIK